jgi:predicted transglutaminase-like cysteine proteinase
MLRHVGWCLVIVVMALQAAAWDPDKTLRAAQQKGPHAVAGVLALRQSLALVKKAGESEQLRAVNDFYNNHIQFRDDVDIWGQVDYWASPLESLQKGAGDCEDFAIAKYFTLIAMGIPHKRMRLVYVRAQLGGISGYPVPHMVLAYYATPDADPLVLDNLVKQVLPASSRPDLTPVFSFNADAIWQGVGSVPVVGTPQERLSRWRDVLLRGQDEGFL